MSLLLACAYAVSAPAIPDIAHEELTRAFSLIQSEAVEARPGEALAGGAARYLAKVPGLGAGAEAAGPVRDVRGLLHHFDALRAQGRVAERCLVEAAVNGMLATLDSAGGYLDMEAQSQAQTQLREAGPAGIGVSVKLDDDVPMIVVVNPGAPADGKLLHGDHILSVDGQETRDQGIDDFVRGLRGAPGSVVTLRVARAGGEPFDVTMTRSALLEQPAVDVRADGTIGVIAVRRFDASTEEAVTQAVAKLRAGIGKPTGYVIDLRGNTGGLLSTTIDFADLFIERGEIASIHGRERSDIQRFFAHRGDLTGGAPLIVLTDPNTASGAEIAAAALRTARGARILGARTYGNGMIQTIIPISKRSAMRLTTAQVFDGAGHAIQGGVSPDTAVEPVGDGSDPVLDAAISLLRGEQPERPSIADSRQ